MEDMAMEKKSNANMKKSKAPSRKTIEALGKIKRLSKIGEWLKGGNYIEGWYDVKAVMK